MPDDTSDSTDVDEATDKGPKGCGKDKYCGHDHDCDCEPPKHPTGLPPCEGDTDPEPEECDPGEEVARRERELAKAQADIANQAKALEDLKAKSTLFEEAQATYVAQAEQREERRKACWEFVDCKEPDLDPCDVQCVETALGDYDTALAEYEDYLDYLVWKLDQAGLDAARAERHHQRAEAHYEWVRRQASECLAGCEDLRAKYDEAVDAEDDCLAYLYWRMAQLLLEAATDGCLDEDQYGVDLCNAFEELCDALDKWNKAKAKLDALEREHESLQAEYNDLKSNKAGALADQVSKCCCQPDPEPNDDETQPKTGYRPGRRQPRS